MDHVLSFEYDSQGEKLEIHADEKGLKYLRQQIELILENRGTVHLFTPSWGGSELSEEKQGCNNNLINHVKIFRWDD